LQREFLDKLIPVLERTTSGYAVIGSIASNYWGLPRFTHDLDVLVVVDTTQARQIAAAFPEPYYVSAEAAAEAAVSLSMFNVLDTISNFKADLWISKGDAFSQSTLTRRRRAELLSGLDTWLGSPEDVLLHKLVWNRITPSDRQLADASGIALVQAGQLDISYLKAWAAQQGTSDVLEAVFQGKYLKTT
jgi:hypothetical protein